MPARAVLSELRYRRTRCLVSPCRTTRLNDGPDIGARRDAARARTCHRGAVQWLATVLVQRRSPLRLRRRQLQRPNAAGEARIAHQVGLQPTEGARACLNGDDPAAFAVHQRRREQAEVTRVRAHVHKRVATVQCTAEPRGKIRLPGSREEQPFGQYVGMVLTTQLETAQRDRWCKAQPHVGGEGRQPRQQALVAELGESGQRAPAQAPAERQHKATEDGEGERVKEAQDTLMSCVAHSRHVSARRHCRSCVW